ncbi:MAG: hypothetical protein M1825_000819 [Sarcosagium campestre]|nr:MAG: hypothetical protein M1825_000819 [Sarcosagium campestre]
MSLVTDNSFGDTGSIVRSSYFASPVSRSSDGSLGFTAFKDPSSGTLSKRPRKPAKNPNAVLAAKSTNLPIQKALVADEKIKRKSLIVHPSIVHSSYSHKNEDANPDSVELSLSRSDQNLSQADDQHFAGPIVTPTGALEFKNRVESLMALREGHSTLSNHTRADEMIFCEQQLTKGKCKDILSRMKNAFSGRLSGGTDSSPGRSDSERRRLARNDTGIVQSIENPMDYMLPSGSKRFATSSPRPPQSPPSFQIPRKPVPITRSTSPELHAALFPGDLQPTTSPEQQAQASPRITSSPMVISTPLKEGGYSTFNQPSYSARYSSALELFSSSPVDHSTPRMRLEPTFDSQGKKRLTSVASDEPSVFRYGASENESEHHSGPDSPLAGYHLKKFRSGSVKRGHSDKVVGLGVVEHPAKKVKKNKLITKSSPTKTSKPPTAGLAYSSEAAAPKSLNPFQRNRNARRLSFFGRRSQSPADLVPSPPPEPAKPVKPVKPRGGRLQRVKRRSIGPTLDDSIGRGKARAEASDTEEEPALPSSQSLLAALKETHDDTGIDELHLDLSSYHVRGFGR